VPMDCWRQWIRHRTASVNEYSTRYSLAIDSMQATPDDEWRGQAATNRQGSAGLLPPSAGHRLTQSEQELQSLARRVYEERLAAGIAREQARKDLPLSTYTEAYWKIDLHNLLHFLALRMDSHAQLEIRRYAETIGREIVQPLFPLVWEAFVDYRLEALRLTRLDQEVIRRLVTGAGRGGLPADRDAFLAAQDPTWAALERCRERDECLAKLQSLGLVQPSPAS
jgi:thymidylate synthase (FAD)